MRTCGTTLKRDVRSIDINAGERGRGDADDGHRHALDDKRPSDDVRVASEFALPILVGNHRHWSGIGTVIARLQQPASHGLDAERLVVRPRDPCPARALDGVGRTEGGTTESK